MKLLIPLRPDPRAPLARANPVAKLAAAAIVMLALFLSIDLVTPTIALAVLLATIPATGLRPGDLFTRTWPLLLAAAALVLLNAAFSSVATGTLLLRMGPVEVWSQGMLAGLAVGLRVLGVALVGLLAVLSTDPTDLADSLQQQLRLPPRFAVGALAAVRLMPAIAQEWQVLRLARRARGVSAGRSPIAAVRIAAGQLLSLLIAAVRRATRLASAMEARAFGSRACRTTARPQRMAPGDWLLIAGGALLALAAVGGSTLLGTWQFLFG